MNVLKVPFSHQQYSLSTIVKVTTYKYDHVCLYTSTINIKALIMLFFASPDPTGGSRGYTVVVPIGEVGLTRHPQFHYRDRGFSREYMPVHPYRCRPLNVYIYGKDSTSS